MPRKKSKVNLPLVEVVIVSLVVHVAGLVILGGMTIWQTMNPVDQVIAEAPPIPPQEPPKVTKVRLDNTQKKSSMPTNVVSVNVTPDLNVPQLDIDIPVVSGRVAIGGAGGGNSFGRGGKVFDFAKSNVNFFNIKDSGERVLFIIDYSGSMKAKTKGTNKTNDRKQNNGPTRFNLLKQQLNQSLSAISSQIFVEMIFFSGPAWVAGEEEPDVKNDYVSAPRTTEGHWHTFRPKDPNKISDPSWKRMSDPERRKLLAQVNRQGLSLGTVWSNPLLIAKKLDPAPDVIYFLTDGSTSDEDVELAYDLVSEWRRENRDLRINTIALGEPRAKEGMEQVARRTGGKFQLIESEDDIEKFAGKDG